MRCLQDVLNPAVLIVWPYQFICLRAALATTAAIVNRMVRVLFSLLGGSEELFVIDGNLDLDTLTLCHFIETILIVLGFRKLLVPQ